MLTNQNKALLTFQPIPIKCCASKYSRVQKISLKASVRDGLNIYSNIQVINQKFGSSTDGHRKECIYFFEKKLYVLISMILFKIEMKSSRK